MIREDACALVLAVFAAGWGGAAAAEEVPVRMTTTMGVIDLVVDLDRAPLTAGNFLRLVDATILDNATFYRTVSPANDKGSPPISVIQGGLNADDAMLPSIAHESTADTGLLHVDGAISMARAELGTASSEFFICIGDQPALDFGGKRAADGQGFAVFGRVVSGMAVVQAIHETPAGAPTDIAYFEGQLYADPIVIRSIRRVSTPVPAPAAAAGTDP
jgi:peptidyl-prolyl cis-trans isomerase A (cyclophilin A)